jgi:hypothetical protein
MDPWQPFDGVALLAYQLWEEEGRPEGRSEYHWLEAERRLRYQQVNERRPILDRNARE